MKKTLLSVGIAAVVMAGQAQAQTVLNFAGNVTSTTCALVPEVGGAQGASINLGDVAPGQAGTAQKIVLKPALASVAGCGDITAKDVRVSWVADFDNNGLANKTGSATGSWVELKATNAKTANTLVKLGAENVDFLGSEIITMSNDTPPVPQLTTDGGLKFDATLNAGTAPGTYVSTASFSVAYN